MKKFFNLLLLLLMFAVTAMAKGGEMPKYDMTGAGSGNEGMVLVKVFVYAKTVTDQDLKRAAVHGVVFRGCTGNNSGAMQPAMASPESENSHAEFCKAFFLQMVSAKIMPVLSQAHMNVLKHRKV